jgi:EXPERA (EXPanded EBP superfamily)
LSIEHQYLISSEIVLTAYQEDRLVSLHLLIWSVETAMSTLTCTVEAMSWDGFTKEERMALAQLYLPYLALGG